MTTRRSFLQTSAVVAGAIGGLPRNLLAAPAANGVARDHLRVLVLGGSDFTGPALVEQALARGHLVTVFNRGHTAPGLFAGRGVGELVGDLSGDVSALEGRTFDVVFDHASAAPAWLRNAARALGGRVGQYVLQYSAESAADRGLVEAEVQRLYPGRASILRVGQVVGPHARSAWFTDWVARVDRGGEIRVTQSPDEPCRFLDVRDLAEFAVHVAEQRAFGRFTVEGPPRTFEELVYGVKATTASPGTVRWLSAALHPGRPSAQPQPTVAAGLRFRSVAETARATLAWQRA